MGSKTCDILRGAGARKGVVTVRDVGNEAERISRSLLGCLSLF